jgi:hypothetical protein
MMWLVVLSWTDWLGVGGENVWRALENVEEDRQGYFTKIGGSVLQKVVMQGIEPRFEKAKWQN